MTKRKGGWRYGSHVILALMLLLIFGAFNQWKTKQISELKLVNKDLISKLTEQPQVVDTTSVKARELLVSTITKLQFRLDPYLVEAYANAIMVSAGRWNLHPNLIACVIFRESSFNPVAVSSAGAEGPMQIILRYHMDKVRRRGWSKQEALYLANNIDIGSEIIREYFDSKRDIRKALSKYVGDTTGNHSGYVDDILTMFTESLNKSDHTTYKDMIMNLEKDSTFSEPKIIVEEKVEEVKPRVIKPKQEKKVINHE